MKPHFDLLKGLGCDVLIYAEAAGNIINEVGAGVSTRPRIEGAQPGSAIAPNFQRLPMKWPRRACA